MKRIAILTSGGDAPGMNAAIRAVVRYGIFAGMEVMGIERGYAGLLEGKFLEMNMRSVSDIIRAVEQLKEHGIEGVIVIGGDGSFMGAKAISELGFPSIGIPGTIDNDLAYTDYTLGFDTACNTILDAINKIRDTMSSHDRVSIIEVMGRNCGDLALYAGLGGGAEVIIVPEHKIDIVRVCERLEASKQRGKHSGIVVLAEGAGKADDLAEKITARTGLSIRSTVLGHLQRGGSPSMKDRFLGTSMGVYAVQLLEKGIGNRVVGIRNNKLYDEDIVTACSMKKKFDLDLYNMASVVAR